MSSKLHKEKQKAKVTPEIRNFPIVEVLIVVPHHCVVPQREDPGCDKNTDLFATHIHHGFIEAGFKAQLIISTKKRSQCDMNRGKECSRSSLFRAKLKATMNREAKITYLIEVHSYKDPKSFKLNDPRVKSVVLYTHNKSSFEKNVAHYTQSSLVPGHPAVNDIAFEATNSGWFKRHVLLEIQQNAKEADLDIISKGLIRAITVHSMYEHLEQRICFMCGKDAVLQCPGCNSFFYCGEEHAERHWDANHGSICVKII